MTTVEEATCSSLWPRTVFDGESGLLSCTERHSAFVAKAAGNADEAIADVKEGVAIERLD